MLLPQGCEWNYREEKLGDGAEGDGGDGASTGDKPMAGPVVAGVAGASTGDKPMVGLTGARLPSSSQLLQQSHVTVSQSTKNDAIPKLHDSDEMVPVRNELLSI